MKLDNKNILSLVGIVMIIFAAVEEKIKDIVFLKSIVNGGSKKQILNISKGVGKELFEATKNSIIDDKNNFLNQFDKYDKFKDFMSKTMGISLKDTLNSLLINAKKNPSINFSSLVHTTLIIKGNIGDEYKNNNNNILINDMTIHTSISNFTELRNKMAHEGEGWKLKNEKEIKAIVKDFLDDVVKICFPDMYGDLESIYYAVINEK